MNIFLSGAVFMAAITSALYFLRFWRNSKDQLFLFFSLGLAILGFERIPLLFQASFKDNHGSIYLIRLFAYLLIIGAILFKNGQKVANK